MFFICCDEGNRTPLQDLMKVRHQSKIRRNGGTSETRTHDLLRVEQTLSPLSYDSVVELLRIELSTRCLSGVLGQPDRLTPFVPHTGIEPVSPR